VNGNTGFVVIANHFAFGLEFKGLIIGIASVWENEGAGHGQMCSQQRLERSLLGAGHGPDAGGTSTGHHQHLAAIPGPEIPQSIARQGDEFNLMTD